MMTTRMTPAIADGDAELVQARWESVFCGCRGFPINRLSWVQSWPT